MSELTLDQATTLNQLLCNGIGKGRILNIPRTEKIPFITAANENTPFKLPELLKSVETHKSFTNRPTRIVKVYWLMDLTDGNRALYYPSPVVKKVIHNNKLRDEIKLNDLSARVPRNVETLWRIDATYILEDGKEVFDHAQMRKYQ